MKPYSLFLIILISSYTKAQNFITDTTAEVVSYWKAGETKQYELTTLREKYVNDALVYKTTSTSAIDMKIVEANPGVYVIEWLYKDVTVNESEEEIPKRFAELGKGSILKYQTSETGMYEKLLNPAAVQDHFAKGMDLMKEKYGIDTVGKQIYQVLKQVFSDEKNTESVFTKEILLYHLPFGAEYTLNQISEEEIKIANPYDGRPFSTLLQFKMVALDTVKMTCRITGTMTVTKEDTKQMIKEFVKDYNNKKPEQTIDASQVPITEIFDTYSHDIDLNTGWLSNANYQRTVVNDIIKQIDTTTIKLIVPALPPVAPKKVKKNSPY